MDIMFTLHAEHEMNCSTAAARHLASSGVDVYTAIAGGLLKILPMADDAFSCRMGSAHALQSVLSCAYIMVF